MDNWVLKSVRNLVKEEGTPTAVSPTQVKVKVTHLLISNFDALLYNGDVQAKYPKTIGRFAVGVVTEVGSDCYGIEKGMRVYLESTRNCGKCLHCKSGKKDFCEEIQLAGRDFDGFLRDFVVCEYTEVAPLPEQVDNLHALCIETVGIAENIYDKLNLSAGQRVAVVGSDFTGNIIAQVLQYHKVIPIVIDNNPGNLERAKKCGVYYAFPADDDLDNNIDDATSGQKCDAAIYSASSRLPLSLPPRLVGKKKSLVLCGFTSMHCSVDARDILSKDLTVFGVSSAYDYTDAVLNMLVHGAVNLDFFDKEIITDYDPVAILKERCENISTANRGKMTVLKMIF
ncbi:MAG: alcohol dehydrogenase catalytic domain-containing protein [Clostridia bacterium]|nr:alcohol dehydrogenase catalytic domain-containing protein [Clostridia bacterium]